MTIETTTYAKLSRGELAAKLQDVFHYAAFAADNGRSTFDERFIRNEATLRGPAGREPTTKQMARVALERAAETFRAAGFAWKLIPKSWTLAQLRAGAEQLVRAVESSAAYAAISAYEGRTVEQILAEEGAHADEHLTPELKAAHARRQAAAERDAAVLSVYCPTCHADAGTPCTVEYRAIDFHQARFDLASRCNRIPVASTEF